MFHRLGAFAAIAALIAPPVLGLQAAGAQSAEQAGYIVDGNVDQALAVRMNRVTDCNISRNAATLAQQAQSLSDETTKLEIRLAQIAAFKNAPTKVVSSPKDPALVALVGRYRSQDSLPQIKAIAQAAGAALDAIANADRFDSYALQDDVPSILQKHREDLELSRDDLLSTLSELRGNWQQRETYRTDLERRGITLDTDFYVTCTGAGFWKIVKSTQTANGQTFDMLDAMSKECEGNGAADSVAYIAQYKRDMVSDDGSESECKNLKVVTDHPEKIEIQKMCLSNGDWGPVTETAEKISDNQVEIQTLSTYSDGNTNTLSSTYQRCDN